MAIGQGLWLIRVRRLGLRGARARAGPGLWARARATQETIVTMYNNTLNS